LTAAIPRPALSQIAEAAHLSPQMRSHCRRSIPLFRMQFLMEAFLAPFCSLVMTEM